MDRTSKMQRTCAFYRMRKLAKCIYTFVFKLKSPVSNKHTPNHDLCADVFDLHAVIELYVVRIQTVTAAFVKTDRDARFNRSVFLITPT